MRTSRLPEKHLTAERSGSSRSKGTRFTTCPLCEAECGLVVELDQSGCVSTVVPDADDPLSRGHMCVKAHALWRLHEDPDRLRHPVRKTAGGEWEEIGWDEALDEAADRLHRIRARHGRDAVAVYVGNPTVHSHESVFGLVGLLTALRTRNRYSATSADQLPHMLAAFQMFGHQLLMPVPDVDRTDYMVIMGANPLASNGSLMTAPGIGRRLRAIRKRGGRVVVIDPRKTETATIADRHHFIRPGTDALLLLSVLHVLFTENLASLGGIERFASGVDELRKLSEEFPPERVAEAGGIDAEEIAGLAREFAGAPSAAWYARVGACTQRFGGLAAWLAYVVNAVTGNLDRAGGIMFTRPAIDVVKLASLLRQKGSFDRWRSRVRGLPEFSGEFPVATLSDEISTPGRGQVKALVTMAGNPVSSSPNGSRLDAALAGLDSMISVDLYINETTRHADLILPPIPQLQRSHLNLVFGLLAVRHTAKSNPPVLEREEGARSDAEILLGLASRLMKLEGKHWRIGGMFASAFARSDFDTLIDSLLRSGPYRLSLREVRKNPHGIDLGPLEPMLPDRLYTPDRRVHLAPPLFVDAVEPLRRALENGTLTGGGLRLIGRRDLRSNNSWMHNVEPLTGAASCTLMMHPRDAEDRGIEEGALVLLRSQTGEVEARVEVSEEVMRGVVSLPHGHGHDRDGVGQRRARQHGGVSANDVTDHTFLDELTGTAAFNGVPVEVAPIVQ